MVWCRYPDLHAPDLYRQSCGKPVQSAFRSWPAANPPLLKPDALFGGVVQRSLHPYYNQPMSSSGEKPRQYNKKQQTDQKADRTRQTQVTSAKAKPITKPITKTFTRPKTRHRFNRAGDIADDIASALFSRDPAHAENADSPQRLSRLNRINDRISHRQKDPGTLNNPNNPNSSHPDHPDHPAQSDNSEITRIWNTCCSQCLQRGQNGPDASEGPGIDGSDVERGHHEGAQLVWIDADEAVVYAQSPVWATRVRMLAPTLVACMRQSGLTEITRLRVRVQPTETVPIPQPRTMAPMSAESGEILSDAADRSNDEGLAARLKRLARHARKDD